MALLKSNQTIREKYCLAVQNELEALGEAEEVKKQWVKFKVAVTVAAVEQIPRVERKNKTKVDDRGYFGSYGIKETSKN